MAYVLQWFDPKTPDVPLDKEACDSLDDLIILGKEKVAQGKLAHIVDQDGAEVVTHSQLCM